MKRRLHPGIDILVEKHADWIAGARVGLVCHPASVSATGVHSAVLLRTLKSTRLACLFGPEHGIMGRGGAGEKIDHATHARWRIPVYSLYGDTRRPTGEMLRDLDVLVFDLQDLGARPYTYVSTLRYVLEAAAEHGKRLVIADRPDPLAAVVDGPMRSRTLESFVGAIPSPTVYGMTPGETAVWLQRRLRLDLDLRVAALEGYRRRDAPGTTWPRWIPPSPAITSWRSALCFPITVFLEALPALDHGRRTAAPFQRFGAPWLDARAVCRTLRRAGLPGIQWEAHRYRAGTGAYADRMVEGVFIRVTHAPTYRPVLTGATILETVQAIHGPERVWSHAGTREDFFDKLMGDRSVRKALQAGRPASDFAARWATASGAFLRARAKSLLYS